MGETVNDVFDLIVKEQPKKLARTIRGLLEARGPLGVLALDKDRVRIGKHVLRHLDRAVEDAEELDSLEEGVGLS